MRWTWKIATVSKIDVYIHATFLLIIGWVGFSYWQQTQTWSGTLEGILFTLVLFGFVMLHEFGHAFAARLYGIKTRDITLYPIGGVARLERMPDKPLEEFIVALAGPAVNVIIAALLFFTLLITNTFAPLAGLSLTTGPFIERLMLVNISLVLFNMIPAFPLDGGRVLRAVLAMRMEYLSATRIAAFIGRGLALLLGLLGLFTNPFLIFIAVFIWIGAVQESSLVQIKKGLSGFPVSKATITNFSTLSPHDTLRRAFEVIFTGSQTYFPVVEDSAVVGMVSRNDVLTALFQQHQAAPIAGIMRRDFQMVDANEMLEIAYLRLQTSGDDTMLVTYHGRLAGLLTTESIDEFLKMQSVLSQTRKQQSYS